MEAWVKLNGQNVPINENTMNSGLVFFHNENLFLWDTSEIVNLVTRFRARAES